MNPILEAIVPYGKNAKEHSTEQILLIAKSIRAFGWQQPIKIGAGGVIIAGHGRFRAWQEYREDFALEEPWIIDEEGKTICGEPEPRKLSEKQEREYRLADNKIAESDWDRGLLVSELSELKELGTDFLELGFSEDDLVISTEGLSDEFSLPSEDRDGIQHISFTLSDEQVERIEAAMKIAPVDEFEHFGNQNSNGNRLYSIVEQWLQNK